MKKQRLTQAVVVVALVMFARAQVAGDFYRTMLVDLLREDLQASALIR